MPAIVETARDALRVPYVALEGAVHPQSAGRSRIRHTCPDFRSRPAAMSIGARRLPACGGAFAG